MLLALSLGPAPVLRDLSWVLSSASELTADGGKVMAHAQSTALLVPSVRCFQLLPAPSFLGLRRIVIGTAVEMFGSCHSEAGDVAVPAPCPRPWCQCCAVPWEAQRSATG